MDARYVATERAILDGMIQLMKEKPLFMVSIKELTRVAGINEATFYRHYKDIDDWKRKYESNFLDYIMEAITPEDLPEWQRYYRKILSQIKSKGEEAQMLVSQNFRSDAIIQAMGRLYSLTSGDPRVTSDKDSIIMEDWNLAFFAGGVSVIIILWCRNGFKESIQEVIDYIGDAYLKLYVTK